MTNLRSLTFIKNYILYVYRYCQLTLSSGRSIGRPSVAADNQPRCPEPTQWSVGICGLGERDNRKGKEGREP
ncbi:hypothetical protein GOODEAATRI_002158 [Goodea atripinnis]|uniref:Uncharacterized protein n=1 Tax=Goodea atripinnis TaxID=208336 RepID=A0ABV0PAP0_9TELE